MTAFSTKRILLVVLVMVVGGFAYTLIWMPQSTLSKPSENYLEQEVTPSLSVSSTIFNIDPDTQCNDVNDWVFENGEVSARVDMKGIENGSCIFELSVAIDGEYEASRCSIELGHLHSTFVFNQNHFEIADIEHHCEQLETGPIGL